MHVHMYAYLCYLYLFIKSISSIDYFLIIFLLVFHLSNVPYLVVICDQFILILPLLVVEIDFPLISSVYFVVI